MLTDNLVDVEYDFKNEAVMSAPRCVFHVYTDTPEPEFSNIFTEKGV